jgi:hypothetical protein
MKHARRLGTVAMALILTAGTGVAQAVINNGTIRMGIRQFGDLNTGSAPQVTGTGTVGLRLITAAGDYESTADGCTCEGWGVGIRSGGTVTTWGGANSAVGGNTNLTAISFTSTASTATSTVRLTAGGLTISHAYAPSSVPNLYQVTVTITNTSGAVIPDVVYRRVMDWDISPTQFNENVRISGWGATNLIGSGSNGFLSAKPLDLTGSVNGCTIGGACNANFETTTGDDRGSFFDFSFGALAAGESKTFETFYGASTSLTGILTALGTVGAEVYTAAWCAGTGGTGPTACAGKNGPAVFAYGFKGVGGTVPPELGTVPEPSTYALMATGLIGVIGLARRRRAVAVK